MGQPIKTQDLLFDTNVLVPNSGDLANVERRFVALRTGGVDATAVVASTKTLTVAAAKAAAAANPFSLTPSGMRAALSRIPTQLIDLQYFVDITDPNPLVFAAAADVVRLQPYRSNLNNFVGLSVANQPNAIFGIQSSVINFFADPTLVTSLVVDGVTIVEVTDAVTGLKSLNTNLNLALDQYKGMLAIVPGTNRAAMISANTLGPNSTIEFAWAGGNAFGGTAALTGSTVNIYSLGGIMRCTSANQGIFTLEAGAGINLLGINCDSPGGGAPFAPNATGNLTGWVGCRVNRANILRQQFQGIIASYVTGVGSPGGRMSLDRNGSPPDQSNSFFENVDFNQINTGLGPYSFIACVAQGCSPLGHGTVTNLQGNIENTQTQSLTALDRCLVRSGTSHGIQYTGGAQMRVRNTRVNACAGSAVKAINSGSIHLDNVAGTGNTRYGIESDGGVDVKIESNVLVDGVLGDMKGGNRPTRTYVDFRSATPANSGVTKDEHDIAANFRQPLKFVFSGLAAATSFDITLLAGSPPAIQCINGLRVTTAGTAALGARIVSDAGDTPSASVATLSDDGKTLTFEGTVTGFTISYIPVPVSTTGSRIWQP